jgi:hypothetical protein
MKKIFVSSKIQGTKNRHILVAKIFKNSEFFQKILNLPYSFALVEDEENYLLSDVSLEYRQLRRILKKYNLFSSLNELLKYKFLLFPFKRPEILKLSSNNYERSKAHGKLLFNNSGNVGNNFLKFYVMEVEKRGI